MEDSILPTRHWLYAYNLLGNGKTRGAATRIHEATGVTYKSAHWMVQRIQAEKTPGLAKPEPEDPRPTGERTDRPLNENEIEALVVGVLRYEGRHLSEEEILRQVEGLCEWGNHVRLEASLLNLVLDGRLSAGLRGKGPVFRDHSRAEQSEPL